MIRTWLYTLGIAIAGVVFSQNLNAATTGLTFAGGCPNTGGGPPLCMPGSNATEDNVAALLGLNPSLVTLVGIISDSQTSPAFSVNSLGATSGTWSISDLSITHIAFKSNTNYILGKVNATSGTWDNSDLGIGPAFGWDISLVDCPAAICGVNRAYTVSDFLNTGGQVAALSNARAFSVVPVPAAVWLFGSGLLGLAAVARRRFP